MKDIISTGSLYLDLALDIGGLRRGQIVEIFGPLCSGKSVLCYNILAQAQREGELVALIDADRNFNRFTAQAAQIELDRVLVALPTSAEDALGMASILVNTAGFSMVAIDSLDSLVPSSELMQPPGEYELHNLAELLSRWLPSLARDLLTTNTLFLVTRLELEDHYPVYHHLKKHLDRLALSFHAGQRLHLIGNHEAEDRGISSKIQVKIVKNRFSPCFKSKSLDIIVNGNLNKIIEVIEIGEQRGLIEQIQGCYFYRETLLGSGRDEVVEFLRNHPEIADQIELSIRQRLLKT